MRPNPRSLVDANPECPLPFLHAGLLLGPPPHYDDFGVFGTALPGRIATMG
jgi:hypothetical protein